MDAIEALLTRRSVRDYTEQPLTEDQIEILLKVMIAAPSAGNRQPWRIYVVREQALKSQLARGALDQDFIASAPVVFVVCRVPEESAARYRDRGRHLYSIQDTAAMTENLLVAAHAMGLGGCWVGAFDDRAIAQALACPKGVLPVAIIPIGYPLEPGQIRSRRSIDKVVLFLPS